MKFLFWLYSIAALAFYGWFIAWTFSKLGTEEFNVFVTFLIAFVVSLADYILIHRMTRAMFGRSIVLAIPDFFHDWSQDSAIAACVMLIIIFLISPVVVALCMLFHVIGCIKTLSKYDY